MSRSYRYSPYGQWCSGSDTWNRTCYHRDERRKVKALLNEQLKKYGTNIWKPVSTCAGINDICDVDDWWCSDPSEYIINYTDTEPRYDYNSDCFLCGWAYEDEDVGPEEEPWDKIVINTIDRSLHSADKYNWASDGGAYYQGSILNFYIKFNIVLKSDGLWKDYVKYRSALHNKRHPRRILKWSDWRNEYYKVTIRGTKQADSDYDLIEFLFHRHLIPLSLWSESNLYEWLMAHEKEIVPKWYHFCYFMKIEPEKC